MSSKVFESALDLIGQTPLEKMSRLTHDVKGEILAKVEYFNPGFSKKDRIALQTIEEAENSGALQPKQTTKKYPAPTLARSASEGIGVVPRLRFGLVWVH